MGPAIALLMLGSQAAGNERQGHCARLARNRAKQAQHVLSRAVEAGEAEAELAAGTPDVARSWPQRDQARSAWDAPAPVRSPDSLQGQGAAGAPAHLGHGAEEDPTGGHQAGAALGQAQPPVAGRV